MDKILSLFKSMKVDRIAYVIRPMWETNKDGWKWVDPMFELYSSIKDKYDIEARYVLPYSSQQYSGLWVDRAKAQNKN